MEAEFNLNSLIREVLATSLMPDPHDVSEEVLRRITNDQLRPALRQCLPALVGDYARRHLNNADRPHFRSPQANPTAAAAISSAPVAAFPERAAKAEIKPRQITRSPKVAAYRELGQQWLRARVYVSADPREWKFMGDCTFTDLMFMAAQRRDQAERTNAKAAEYERLADLMQAHDVTRVRDLPADVLRGVGDVAA